MKKNEQGRRNLHVNELCTKSWDWDLFGGDVRHNLIFGDFWETFGDFSAFNDAPKIQFVKSEKIPNSGFRLTFEALERKKEIKIISEPRINKIFPPLHAI